MEIKQLLSRSRLVTLAGSGGCGKTRLALQVADSLVSSYVDGVWLVELASVSDPGLVPKTVASVFRIPEQPGLALSETLKHYFQTKSLLLVIDNCEHLLPTSAEVAETLLRTCPNLKILATSRQSLGISGEATWRVPSLSLPDLREIPTADHLQQYEATRLFIERASFSQSSFSGTDGNAAAISQVCHRLDGIPLAIELAAARVKVLSVAQIAAHLDDRFRFLAAGRPKTLPRQQTLRAAMDWSYDLLSDRERTLFMRLSVFTGGWTLEAAQTVCAGNDVQASNVLDLLTQLVDKSLVEVETKGKEARYWLLETVRQYGLERLAESEEAPTVRRRHLDWYLSLAERMFPKLRGPEQEASLEQLEAEHDNMRAALAWSKTNDGLVETWLRLAGALGLFWQINGHWSEGRRWLEEALTQSSKVQPSALARVMYGAGGLAYQQGDYERTRDLCERALALFQTLGDKYGIIRAICGLSNAVFDLGDAGRATALAEESVALSRELGDKWLIGYTLQQLASYVRAQGDYERAARLGTESITLCKEVGDRFRTAAGLRAMGVVWLRQRDYGRAAAFYVEGLKLCQELRNRWVSCHCIEGLGCVASAQGHYERAAMLFGAAEALRESLRSRQDTDYQAEVVRYVNSTRSSLGDFAFATACTDGRAMTLEQVIAYALAPGSSSLNIAGSEKAALGKHPGHLTRREEEIAALIAQGLTNRRIATRLVIAKRTADTHVQHILNKLGVNSRAEIAAWAVEHGLHISLPGEPM